MLILGLDTTQPTVQISLIGETQKFYQGAYYVKRMESLPSLLKQLFEHFGFRPQDLTAIGVITGPGNYTGIRAGMMVVKTLTYRYQLPLYGMHKIEAAFYSLRSLQQPLSPIFNVRQGQVYTGVGQWLANRADYQIAPHSTDLDSWLQRLPQEAPSGLLCSEEPLNYPQWLPLGHLAQAMAEWTRECVHSNISPLTEVQPFYIRPAVQTGPKESH